MTTTETAPPGDRFAAARSVGDASENQQSWRAEAAHARFPIVLTVQRNTRPLRPRCCAGALGFVIKSIETASGGVRLARSRHPRLGVW